MAPDFELKRTPDQTLRLSGLRGQPVVLAFYPADWSPVCTDQMVLYQEIMPMFREYNAHVLGLSVDGPWCHAAFAGQRNIRFPLLSDFEPKGEVSRDFRVYRSDEGVADRGLFVIDQEGKVAWSYLSPVAVNPGADGILRALKALHENGGQS